MLVRRLLTEHRRPPHSPAGLWSSDRAVQGGKSARGDTGDATWIDHADPHRRALMQLGTAGLEVVTAPLLLRRRTVTMTPDPPGAPIASTYGDDDPTGDDDDNLGLALADVLEPTTGLRFQSHRPRADPESDWPDAGSNGDPITPSILELMVAGRSGLLLVGPTAADPHPATVLRGPGDVDDAWWLRLETDRWRGGRGDVGTDQDPWYGGAAVTAESRILLDADWSRMRGPGAADADDEGRLPAGVWWSGAEADRWRAGLGDPSASPWASSRILLDDTRTRLSGPGADTDADGQLGPDVFWLALTDDPEAVIAYRRGTSDEPRLRLQPDSTALLGRDGGALNNARIILRDGTRWFGISAGPDDPWHVQAAGAISLETEAALEIGVISPVSDGQILLRDSSHVVRDSGLAVTGGGGNLIVNGNLTVTGTSTLMGAVTAGGNLIVNGNLTVTGTSTLMGAVTADGVDVANLEARVLQLEQRTVTLNVDKTVLTDDPDGVEVVTDVSVA